MKKQVAKSQIFTKESLTRIQNVTRLKGIESFNRVYSEEHGLKEKKQGRNFDVKSNIINDLKGKLDSALNSVFRLNCKVKALKEDVTKFKAFFDRVMRFFKRKVAYGKDNEVERIVDEMRDSKALDVSEVELIKGVKVERDEMSGRNLSNKDEKR